MRQKLLILLTLTFISSLSIAHADNLPPKVGGKSPVTGNGTATIPTFQLIEEAKQGNKGGSLAGSTSIAKNSNTFRLEPTGTEFSGPIRVCKKYGPNETTSNVANTMISALKGLVAADLKDRYGKATYQIVGVPEQDYSNKETQMCVTLKPFA